MKKAIGVGLLLLIVGLVIRHEGGDESLPAPPPLTGDPFYDDIRHLGWLLRHEWSWRSMREARGLDLDQLESECLARVQASPDQETFALSLRRFLAGIHDGHASLTLDWETPEPKKRWPFSLVEAAEGLMVDGINPATFSAGTLRPGDLVLEVDKRPIDELVAEREKLEFASTPGTRRRKAIMRLTRDAKKEAIELKVHRRGRPASEVVRLLSAAPNDPVPRRSWRRFSKKFRLIDDRTAYFCPGDFSPAKGSGFREADADERLEILKAQFQEYAAVFEEVAGRPNLILDLRGNPGGTDLLGKALALHLLDPGSRYYRLASKRGAAWEFVSWSVVDDTGLGAPRFRGRLICLIDEMTFSVADNFACCLRDCHPDIVFVGQPTGGGSGAPRRFVLPSTGAVVRFCTMQVKAPNGEWVEGNGVVPDHLIRPSIEDLMAERDAVYEKALKLLR